MRLSGEQHICFWKPPGNRGKFFFLGQQKAYCSINSIVVKLISIKIQFLMLMKGKSNPDGRSQRAADGGSAVPEVEANGPRKWCREITVAASGKSSVSLRQDIAVYGRIRKEWVLHLGGRAFYPQRVKCFFYNKCQTRCKAKLGGTADKAFVPLVRDECFFISIIY